MSTGNKIDFKYLIMKTREKARQPPRKFNSSEKSYNRISLPLLMRLVGGKYLKPIYKNCNLVLENGKIIWGFIIQANELLFEPGKIDSAGQVIFSMEPVFDSRVDALAQISDRIIDLLSMKWLC